MHLLKDVCVCLSVTVIDDIGPGILAALLGRSWDMPCQIQMQSVHRNGVSTPWNGNLQFK